MALPFIVKALSLGRVAMNLKTISNVIQEASGITKQIREIRKGAGGHDQNLEGRVSKLEREVMLQAKLNEKLNEQMERVQSVLENVHRSIRFLVYTIYGIGAIALAAIVIALLK